MGGSTAAQKSQDGYHQKDQKAAPERDVSGFRAAIIRNGNGKSPQRALRGGTKGVTTESKENSLIPHNF